MAESDESQSNESFSASTLAVRHWLERHQAGDAAARGELLQNSLQRLQRLARHIMSDIPAIRNFAETDDLLQNSLVRLWKCLDATQPETALDYFRLAACLIRRELIDLARHHLGTGQEQDAADSGASGHRDFSPDRTLHTPLADDTFDPEKLSQWTEFHEYVENLPGDESVLFDLLWYQGLTMADASELLGVPVRTLGRRWKAARVRLYRELMCEPGVEPQDDVVVNR